MSATMQRSGLSGSLKSFDESHGLIVLLLVEFGLFVLLGRRARGRRSTGEE